MIRPRVRTAIPSPDLDTKPGPIRGPLSKIAVGDAFTVRRITEELEFEPGLLEFLEASAIQPGNVGTVTALSPDGTLTVEIEGLHVGVGSFASERILVTA